MKTNIKTKEKNCVFDRDGVVLLLLSVTEVTIDSPPKVKNRIEKYYNNLNRLYEQSAKIILAPRVFLLYDSSEDKRKRFTFKRFFFTVKTEPVSSERTDNYITLKRTVSFFHGTRMLSQKIICDIFDSASGALISAHKQNVRKKKKSSDKSVNPTANKKS